MADIVYTPANVKLEDLTTQGVIKNRVAFAAGEAGQAVYLDTALNPNKWKLADATMQNPTKLGITLNDFAANQGVWVATADSISVVEINFGAVFVQGQFYVVSATSGKIALLSDLTTGQFINGLGFAKTTSILRFAPDITEIAKP